jgi:hypothetical protein
MNHPTVVMDEKKSDQSRKTPLVRYVLYVALALAIAYAAWVRMA